MDTNDIFLLLLLISGNINFYEAKNLGESTAYVPPLGPNNGRNPLEEAVTLLQLEKFDAMKKEIKTLKQDNENKDKDIKDLKENERISKEVIEKMKIDRLEEMKNANEKHEKRIKEIQEANLENEVKFQTRITGKETMIEYLQDVLRESDSLIKYWQELVKTQALQLNKMENYQDLQKALKESQRINKIQSESIKNLEEVIVTKEKLMESYQNLEKLDPEKSNCEISPWMNTLTVALTTQKKEIKTITGYVEDRKDVEEHLIAIDKHLENFEIPEAVDNHELVEKYVGLISKQGKSMNLMRNILTENSSIGLAYEEDEDGVMISSTTCECIPTPPNSTDLYLASMEYRCKEDTSKYTVGCRGEECTTHTWPTCGLSQGQPGDQVVVGHPEYKDCEEVTVPYLNKTISCGKDGWMTKSVESEVGQGVFRQEVRTPCLECNQNTFHWSTWQVEGNKMTRSRGSNSVENSFQQEEIQGVLMYEESGYKYFKVPVAYGTRINVGVVTDTCEAHQMKSVCFKSGCSYNSDGCRVTPLSTYCGSPMVGLSQKICSGKSPNACPSMDGMFSDHKSSYNSREGACGTLSGFWCAAGKNFVSSEAKPLYAYCVL